MSKNSLEKHDGNNSLIRYSEEYRINAVKMVLIDGFSIEKTAATLGCARESVRRWVGIYRNHVLPQNPSMSVDEEIKKLRKENDLLKRELEFLKKRRRTLRKSRSKVRVY